MQDIAIEQTNLNDMVGCSNHWSLLNSLHYTLVLTSTVGSTTQPMTSEGYVEIASQSISHAFLGSRINNFMKGSHWL